MFAEVARGEFDKSPLDIHGRQPFTLIAWPKFVGLLWWLASLFVGPIATLLIVILPKVPTVP